LATPGTLCEIALQNKGPSFESIVKNKTDIPFLTSDNPVSKQNQYMEKRNWPAGHVGIACIGLQILLPIDPSTYLILFDKDIYKVGRNREQIIEVNKKDVEELNQLQYLNADETIYFTQSLH